MRYTVYSENGDEFTFEAAGDGAGGVYVDGRYHYTKDNFREFRKAVGYIWQEIEND